MLQLPESAGVNAVDCVLRQIQDLQHLRAGEAFFCESADHVASENRDFQRWKAFKLDVVHVAVRQVDFLERLRLHKLAELVLQGDPVVPR